MTEHAANEWFWLDSTEVLQTETYGYDFEAMAEDVGELAHYIEWNVFAAFQELAEASVEFSWKPWAVDKPFVNRARILAEMVDVCHFVGNILVGLGVTDEEWADEYKKKQDLNRRRASSGSYSAQKGGLGEGSDNE